MFNLLIEESHSPWFWGILAWTNQYWRRLIEKLKNDSTMLHEGQLLNTLSPESPLSTVKLGQYLDLGTWQQVSRFVRVRIKYIDQITLIDEEM